MQATNGSARFCESWAKSVKGKKTPITAFNILLPKKYSTEDDISSEIRNITRTVRGLTACCKPENS